MKVGGSDQKKINKYSFIKINFNTMKGSLLYNHAIDSRWYGVCHCKRIMGKITWSPCLEENLFCHRWRSISNHKHSTWILHEYISTGSCTGNSCGGKKRNPYLFQIYMILNCISVFLLVTREFNVNKIQMLSCLLLDQYYQLITSAQNLRFMVLLLLRSNHPMCP